MFVKYIKVCKSASLIPNNYQNYACVMFLLCKMPNLQNNCLISNDGPHIKQARWCKTWLSIFGVIALFCVFFATSLINLFIQFIETAFANYFLFIRTLREFVSHMKWPICGWLYFEWTKQHVGLILFDILWLSLKCELWIACVIVFLNDLKKEIYIRTT